MLIVLEGLPGAGKTTTLQLLAGQKATQVINELIDKPPQNEDEGFYLENDRKKYALIDGSRPTLMDRNFVSTLCYNHCSDKRFKTSNYESINKSIKKLLKDNLVWQPDLYIVLECSIKTSLTRQDTANNTAWLDEEFLKNAQCFYKEYFKNNDCNYIFINSDATSVEVIAEKVSEALAQFTTKKGPIYV